MKKKVLECISISKSLDKKPILADFSLTVHEGQVRGLVGPVGVGKTSLLYMILGLIQVDTGQIKIFGESLEESKRKKILGRMNFASSSAKLGGYSTVWENLITFANLYEISKPKEQIEKLADVFKIQQLISSKRKLYNLSAGELTKVMICKSFLNNPDLLLFDEITAHLDPPSIVDLHSFIQRHMSQKGKSILWVSHSYEDIKNFCTAFTIIKNKKAQTFNSILSEKKFNKLYV